MERSGILLVGGNGFLGTLLAKSFADDGRSVHVLSRSVVPGVRSGIHYHRGSQCEKNVVGPLLEQCATVVHLAAVSTPAESDKSYSNEASGSILPTAEFLDIMAAEPPRRLLYVSSGGAIYGNPVTLPAKEGLSPSPVSAHAASKVALEAFFSTFSHNYGVSLAILRPSNLYGPGQPLRSNFGLVRTVFEKLASGGCIEVRGNGQAIRDYLYIDDAVDACRRLIDKEDVVGIYNAGGGIGVSVNDLIKLCASISGLRAKVKYGDAPSSDVNSIVLDSSKLTFNVGWAPSYQLEKGLRLTWEWLTDSEKL